MNNNSIVWLQEWYMNQCDGDWEHSYGIEIATLDNPGWSLRVNLDDTAVQSKVFSRIDIKRSEADWLCCWVGEGEVFGQPSHATFQAFCGGHNLTEVLDVFRSWAENVNTSMLTEYDEPSSG